MMLAEVLLGLLLLLLLILLADGKPRGLPPGIWGWPVVGQLPGKDVSLSERVKQLRQVHGDIVSWRMGTRLFVFLCNHKLIRSAFAKPEFSFRPDLFSQKAYTEFTNAGLSFTDGAVWLNHRRFALRQLKDLGLGKSSLEVAILHEAHCLKEDFKKYTGSPKSLPWSINVAVLNVIWKLTADRRYDVGDQEIQDFNKLINRAVEMFGGLVQVYDLFPWLQRLVPPFMEERSEIGEYKRIVSKITHFMAEVIEDHQVTLDPSKPRDYIDSYLIEMNLQKQNPESTMSVLDLRCGVASLFIAGSISVSATLKGILHLLARHPGAQERIQKEIDEATSGEALPTLEDRKNLPYLEATILEGLRLINLTPVGLAHRVSQDTIFEGFSIPKDALLLSHIECCHTDPLLWEKPTDFYPEHFLDAEGKVLSKKDGFLPFSVGRRQCIGEQLARVEIFLFLGALLKNFSFSAPDGLEELSSSLTDEPTFIIVNR